MTTTSKTKAPSGAAFKIMKTLFQIIYFIVAMSPIFALGYMLGLKLMEQ
jgi:hypothetical protein